MSAWRVIEGDCIEAMRAMEPESIDAVVTDPPYGIGFMGHEWDQPTVEFERAPGKKQRQPDRDTGAGHRGHDRPDAMNTGRYDLSPPAMKAFQAWSAEWAAEAWRVLKPGGYLLVFAGTRTYHRMASGVEDAGFEIRDCIAWMYGSGFPKSLDVSKAIDKGVGTMSDREVVTTPATPDAGRWQGWGTALKPAHEPIVMARKPLSERNVAANVLRWGTGGLNIDGTRIEGEAPAFDRMAGDRSRENYRTGTSARTGEMTSGRWPANVILDEEAGAMLDEQSGGSKSSSGKPRAGRNGEGWGMTATGAEYDDTGGASRFFYCPKADRAEREKGVEHMTRKALLWSSGEQSPGTFQAEGTLREAANHHPTVKPVELMRWLVRLVTPPGGTVLDPFTGSGTTGIAALREGFGFVGIEREAEYVEIARARIVGDAPLFNAGLEQL